MKRSIFHAIFVRFWTPLRTLFEKWPFRPGWSSGVLQSFVFPPPNTSSLKKRNFPSVLLLAGKKKRKMFWLKQ
jgi:hypothetical protein